MHEITEDGQRRAIVKVCRALAQHGLVAATDGNVSARLSPDRFLATPSGLSKGDINEGDLIVCGADGKKISGGRDLTSEFQVHLAAYRTRPGIGAVVHAHPPAATAFTFAGLGHLFSEPIVPEVVAQIGPIPLVPYLTPGTRELAEAFAHSIKDCDVVLLAQHGAVAVAQNPWAAWLRMEKLEQLAVILKTAHDLCGGDEKRIKRLSPAEAEQVRTQYGKKSY